ncbi:uncharacterized protein LOC134183127 [Corticium candelabrum]|uniref:uncharacterized protein LOC134183127 n=1 Tax=Corticium candelabrum TaxID=121492 RepID=UPI002E26E28C|nr:uncharacterized protein LOC134183127 [Corticium candelabrum]
MTTKISLIALALAVMQCSGVLVDYSDPCAGVRCPKLTCSFGAAVRREGKCCAECEDPCVKKTCPEFTRCVSDEYNTRAWCEETCEWNGKCADDEICEVVSLPVHEGCSKTTTCKRTDHCKVAPTSIEDFCFSWDGTDRCVRQGMPFCTHIDVKDTTGPWKSVYICSCKDWGMKWSNYGPISGMTCTWMSEPMKTWWGNQRYLCVPEWWSFSFIWSHSGIPMSIQSSDCMEWSISGDRSWKENHLCKVTPLSLSEFKFSNDGPIPSWECHKLWQPITGRTFTGGWDNNYICTSRDVGMTVNFREPIEGMSCTWVKRCNMTSWWPEPYVCVPYWWDWSVEFYSDETSYSHLQCVDWSEPEDMEWSGAICSEKKCPITKCKDWCPNGYIFDDSGCMTCKCKPDWCAFVQCPKTMCKNVVWKDGECCPKCADEMMAMSCPTLYDCPWRCSYGFKKDSSGCDMCECRENPCDVNDCSRHQECVVDPTTFKAMCWDTCKNNGPCEETEDCVMKTPWCDTDVCRPVAVCEPRKSKMMMKCNRTCPGGHRWRTASMCTCKPDHCATVKCPATPMCESPVYVNNECCSRCPPVCAQVNCTHACKFGYELDDFGCQSCICKPRSCWNVACPELDCAEKVSVYGQCCMKCKKDVVTNCPLMKCVPCPNGYYTDSNGCPTCTCKPDYCSGIACPSLTCANGATPIYRQWSCCAVCPENDVCPKKTCDMWCPGGYEYDVNGCMMCKCKPDYCQTVKCKWPTECTKPVYVPGKCCPHCSTVEPMVAFSSGYISKYWNVHIGHWMTDIKTWNTDYANKAEVVKQCRAMYPGMVFWDAQLSTEYVVIKDWCSTNRSPRSQCNNSTNMCTKSRRVQPYRCIGSDMQWPVDFHFGYEGMSNWDQSNWNCETIRPDSGYNTHNYFCSRWQMPIRWSFTGPIASMQCVKVTEPKDTTWSWKNTYMCLPKTFQYRLRWFSDGLPSDWNKHHECMRWPLMVDGKVGMSWEDNWMCLDTYDWNKWDNFVCNKSCSFGFKTTAAETESSNPKLVCECKEDPCVGHECNEFQECQWDRWTGKPWCVDSCKNNWKCGATETCELRTPSCWSEPCHPVAVCKPRCHSWKTCSLSCPAGFVSDVNGWPMCKCRPMNCSHVTCPRPMCDKPVMIEGECCPACPAQCKCMRVTRWCASGYEMDEWGCYMNKCKPDKCVNVTCPRLNCTKPINLVGECCPKCSEEFVHKCPEWTCTNKCPGGYYVDRWGCKTCTCKPEHCASVTCPATTCTFVRPGQCCADCKQDVCPHRQCKLYCKNGYEFDMNGCPLCMCKPRVCSTWNAGRIVTAPKCDHPVSLMGKCGWHCPTWSRGHQCPELYCSNPVYVNGHPCPRCPSRCTKDTKCEQPCPNGYVWDRDGCMTCKCRPSSCSNVTCPHTECSYPAWETGSCCPTCAETCDKSSCTPCPVNTTPVTIKGSCCPQCMNMVPTMLYVCPAVYNCTNACPGGYEYDLFGCPTCVCKPDSCRTVQCPARFKCDHPVHYEGECCKRCPSQFKYTLQNRLTGYLYKSCPKLKCERPVFMEWQECPVCAMRPSFPADFRFVPSWLSKEASEHDWLGWEKTPMTWENSTTTSYMMSSMPTGMRWSTSGPIHGMRCTYVGPPEANYWDKKTWLCWPEWSDVRVKFYWDMAKPVEPVSRCMRIKDVDSSWPVSWLCANDKKMSWWSDFQFSYLDSTFWTNLGWTCLAITPQSTKYGWNDNFMCTRKDLGWRWSNSGPIEGMDCTYMDSDAKTWGENNYLCVPVTSKWELLWSNKPQKNMHCVWWKEPSHNSWGEHYLCLFKKECRDADRQIKQTCSLECSNTLGYALDQDGCPICQCRQEATCKDKMCWFGFKKDEFGVDTCECRPWPCPDMSSCDKTCTNGFEYSTLTGCVTCQCKPNKCDSSEMLVSWFEARRWCSHPVSMTKSCEYKCPMDHSPSPWCASGQCPVLTCKNPVKVEGECCAKCKPQCPQVKCPKPCEHGYRQNFFGCPTCQCNPKPISSMSWLTKCPLRKCAACSFGYYTDWMGCQTCKCVPESCASVSCPTPTCPNPVYKSGQCCGVCEQSTCPRLLCKRSCPDGYEYDENGCPTCSCKPADYMWWWQQCKDSWSCSSEKSWPWSWWRNDAWWWRNNAGSWRNDTWWWDWWQSMDCDNPVSVWSQHKPYCPKKEGECPPRWCSESCPYGYKKDKWGCDTCQCMDKHFAQCPAMTCELTCTNGYQKDSDGCDTCQCKVTEKVRTCPPRCTYDFCMKNLHSSCSVAEEDLDMEYKSGRCSGTSTCCITSCRACHFGSVTSVKDQCTRCSTNDVECIFHFGHCARNHWCTSLGTVDVTHYPCVRYGERRSGVFRCSLPWWV